VAEKLCGVLGVRDMKQVEMRLYKLLVYETGGHFAFHRDSPKTDGMFGSLVVVLPSPFEGGELLLKHGEETISFDSHVDSEFGTSAAAWYADVLHSIQPVTSGYRLVLSYNLSTISESPAPTIPSLLPNAELKAALSLLHDDQEQAGYILDHLYPNISLSYSTLKGPDRAVVDYLSQIADEMGFDIWLATFNVHWEGPEEREEEWYEDQVECDWKVDMVECVAGPDRSRKYRSWGAKDFGETEEEFFRMRGMYDYESHYTGNEGYRVSGCE
jgi:hypothetical protein